MTAFSKSLAVVSAAGLAFAPIAAQAGTRAESSPVVVDVQRGSAPVTDSNEIFGLGNEGYLILLLLLAAAIAAIVAGRSRGSS